MDNKLSRRSFMASCLATGVLLSLPGNFAFASAQPRRHYTESRLLMGTIVSITVAHKAEEQARQAIGLAFAEMERLQGLLDRHQPSTPMGQLNINGKLKNAPDELLGLTTEALSLGQELAGAFDISVAPLVDLFKHSASSTGKFQLAPCLLSEAQALLGQEAIRIDGADISFDKNGMKITLDGIAKGYITDAAAKVLSAAGIKNYLVNSGGDVYASGLRHDGKPWQVAVQSPEKDGAYPAVCALSNQALATSGNYENYYDAERRYHHLIAPENRMSQPYFKSVSVLAPTTKQADALATGLSALPLETAIEIINQQADCAALFITTDKRIVRSSRWA